MEHVDAQVGERLIDVKEVCRRVGVKSRSTLWKWYKRGEFPKPVKVGARLIRWRESEVAEWEANRLAAG